MPGRPKATDPSGCSWVRTKGPDPCPRTRTVGLRPQRDPADAERPNQWGASETTDPFRGLALSAQVAAAGLANGAAKATDLCCSGAPGQCRTRASNKRGATNYDDESETKLRLPATRQESLPDRAIPGRATSTAAGVDTRERSIAASPPDERDGSEPDEGFAGRVRRGADFGLGGVEQRRHVDGAQRLVPGEAEVTPGPESVPVEDERASDRLAIDLRSVTGTLWEIQMGSSTPTGRRPS